MKLGGGMEAEKRCQRALSSHQGSDRKLICQLSDQVPFPTSSRKCGGGGRRQSHWARWKLRESQQRIQLFWQRWCWLLTLSDLISRYFLSCRGCLPATQAPDALIYWGCTSDCGSEDVCRLWLIFASPICGEVWGLSEQILNFNPTIILRYLQMRLILAITVNLLSEESVERHSASQVNISKTANVHPFASLSHPHLLLSPHKPQTFLHPKTCQNSMHENSDYLRQL